MLPFAWSGVAPPRRRRGSLRVRLTAVEGDGALRLARRRRRPASPSLAVDVAWSRARSTASSCAGRRGATARLLPRSTWPARRRSHRAGDGDRSSARRARTPARAPCGDGPAALPARPDARAAASARGRARRQLRLQRWLADERLATPAWSSSPRAPWPPAPARTPTSARRRSGAWCARAQPEHPGRFVLIDTDGSEASRGALRRGPRRGAEPSPSSPCARARRWSPRLAALRRSGEEPRAAASTPSARS